MSSLPYTDNQPSGNHSTIQAVIKYGVRHTKVAMFWSAIILPVGYLPLLIGGLTTTETTVFIALMISNAIALCIGHDYQPSNP
ncbi:MAG: hypothetical protein J07HQW2_01304 [Haloquadratum walsbyi J07HQW2]|uniref:Uncharacterized protein n=1 Tax=Haloquadratum walsbyi J07HQW2 TaxID=1238425 RepID=U1PMC6_9EURY|nr:MAG: hypothetical protein J07HQW2_01304 [Haloquadratum walsbyi J07HQW2]